MRFELFGRLKKRPSSRRRTQQGGVARTGNHTSHSVQSHGITDKDIDKDIQILMSQKNMHEAELIDKLHNRGYKYSDIDRALNKSVRGAVEGKAFQDSSQGIVFNDNSFNTSKEDKSLNEHLIPSTHATMPVTESQNSNAVQGADYSVLFEEVEQIVDDIITEKFSSIVNLKEEIDENFENLTKRIKEMESVISEHKTREESNDDSISSQVNTLKNRVEDIIPQIEGMEKAFKDIIPNLIDNVRELNEKVSNIYNRSDVSDSSKVEGSRDLKEVLFDDLNEPKDETEETKHNNEHKTKDNKHDRHNDHNRKEHKESNADKKIKKVDKNGIDDFDYSELLK